MRRLPLRSASFDAVTLMDAFGFFEAEEENEAVLAELARVMVPGGRFALKVVNGNAILAKFRDTDREERDDTVVTLSRTLALDPPRMIERIVVSDSRGTAEYERRQRLYQAQDLCGMLDRAGLSVVIVTASALGAAFEPATSATMWVIGQRIATPSGHALQPPSGAGTSI